MLLSDLLPDFLGVSKALKGVAKEIGSIRIETETLTRQREDVQFAPACMSDVLTALEVWAIANEGKYRNYLKIVLERLVTEPAMLTNQVDVWRHLHQREILPEPNMHVPISRDIQLCGLLGAARFIEMMKVQLEAMEWLGAGLPMNERPAAIDLLDRKIYKLRAREAAIIESAEKAGLNIS